MMRFVILILIFLMFPSPLALAQEASPIEITADNSLEWDRDANTFSARGNAVVAQDKTSITADTVIANYTDDDNGFKINKIVAHGGSPTVKTETETLTATTLTAFFTGDAKTALHKVIAENNVTITTAQETLSGDYAEYRPEQQTATVTGNVKIIDGKNILTGDRAEFDMSTNTSTLKSDTANGERVKAIFYPGQGAQ